MLVITGAGGVTLIYDDLIRVELVTVPFPTVRLTEYRPAFGYVYTGFWAADVFPSPKAHDHELTGPVDLSVNVTAMGLTPVTGVAVKFASTGSGGLIVT